MFAYKKLPNYVRRFGAVHGIRLLMQVERSRSNAAGRIRAYRRPGDEVPVYLRDTVADHAIFWQCLVMCQYETSIFPHHQRLISAYESMLARGETPLIIDCGANIGLATRWFGERFPEARIVAIEPDAGNMAMVERNTAHLQTRVTRLLGGVWPQAGWLRIQNPTSGSTAFRVERVDSEQPGSMRAYTIQQILDMMQTSSPLIVKIDIEGAQDQLFRSNTDWVARSHLISLELDDWLLPWQGSSRSFFKCMSSVPFEYLLSGESIFCFRDFSSSET
jgi:FkbM family methyltransferase